MEWNKRSNILPLPASYSPPANSAQKVHPEAVADEQEEEEEEEAAPPPPAVVPTYVPVPLPQHTSTLVIQQVNPAQLPVAPNLASHLLTRSRTAAANAPTYAEPNEMLIDVETTVEADDEQDDESAKLMRHLDSTLPKWPGFEEEGWLEEPPSVRPLAIHPIPFLMAAIAIVCRIASYYQEPQRHFVRQSLLYLYHSYPPFSGNRLAAALEAVPEQTTMPSSSKSVNTVLSNPHYNLLTLPQDTLSLKTMEVCKARIP